MLNSKSLYFVISILNFILPYQYKNSVFTRIKLVALLYKIPSLFDLKIVLSYVIEVADSESDVGLHDKSLVSKIFAFYHLLEMHYVVIMYTLVTLEIFFENFEGFWVVLSVFDKFYGF